MSDSSSSSTSFVLILLALGGCAWLVQQAFTEPPKPAPATPAAAEEESSTYSRAVDFSKTNGEALNNAINDQLKSAQQMTGGTFDGQTYLLPQAKK